MRDLAYMESEVLRLLQLHANDDYARDELAPWIAKTSLQMGHLYSDLGLASREEMGAFMKKNFTSLAKLKPEDKRWKKYLYDCIGKTAPACATCYDISNCFNCSFNPEKIAASQHKESWVSSLKKRMSKSKRDLLVLISFEIAIVLGSILFVVQ